MTESLAITRKKKGRRERELMGGTWWSEREREKVGRVPAYQWGGGGKSELGRARGKNRNGLKRFSLKEFPRFS